MDSSESSSGLTCVTVDITRKWFTVVINTSNSSLHTARRYKRGYTMCILNAEILFGENRQCYCMVEDISRVEVRFSYCLFHFLTYIYGVSILAQLLPVSLAKLWELNDSLRNRSDAGNFRGCLSCGNDCGLVCAKCRSRYCSEVRTVSFSSTKTFLMSTRNVSALIGPNISMNVKLWALFFAIIEQTLASGTWVFASYGAPHDDT